MMVVVMMMMVIKICHNVNGSANDYDGNDVTLMVIDDEDDGDNNGGGGGGGSSCSRVWQGYIFPIGSLLPAEDERKSSCICRLP